MADLTLLVAGQSNGTQMCIVPVAGCNPISGCYVFTGSAWRAMTSSDGAGMIEIANTLRSHGYDNVYVYDCCYGGSAIVPVAASPSTNCWPMADCTAQITAGGKLPHIVIWIQGEQETQYCRLNPSFDMVTAYTTYLDALRRFLLGQWGTTAAQCVWMVTPVGSVSYGDVAEVRQAQTMYANSTSGVILGPSRADLALLNEGGVQVHLSGPSCLTFGDRIASVLVAYLQGEIMTDPQDKAAIASLQTAVASLQSGISSLQAGVNSLLGSALALQNNVTRLQENTDSLNYRIGLIEPLNGLSKWPQPWPLSFS